MHSFVLQLLCKYDKILEKLKRTKVKAILENGKAGEKILVKGWVRTKRGSKNVNFVDLNDGSTIKKFQIVVEVDNFDSNVLDQVTTGASIAVTGNLVESQGGQQSVELVAETLEVLGVADPDQFPIQPKKHTMEFLRENAHLRMRTNTMAAVMRIRNQAAYAVHNFFQEKGFVYLHTPIITGSDAEGAGEMFKVTTFELNKAPTTDDGQIDFKKDFFGTPTNLTVSGQLEGELGAMALGDVYTFGPTFRAENSNTSRHLAEFWMIEPEMAFCDLQDDMDVAEEFLKHLINSVLENCTDDLEFLKNRALDEEKTLPQDQRNELDLIERLKFVLENNFERLTYTDAIKVLMNSKPYKKGKFKYPVEWGIDLQSEHERYLVEKHFKKPVILIDYPKDIKAFYMKVNEDNKTVGAMDVLFPGIGEIIGGSQREERLEVLRARMDEMNVPQHELEWYLDTRRFGTAPHAGFGLGFERFVLFATGMGNVRDVIPFPRTPQNAAF